MALKQIEGRVIFNTGKYPSLDGSERVIVSVPIEIEDFDAG